MDFNKIKTFFGKAGYGITIFVFGITVGSLLNVVFPSTTILNLPISATSTQEITLQEVKVAFDKESEQAILLNRKNNNVVCILNKDLTTTIYSYKSDAIQLDIENSKKSSTPVPIKNAR